MDTIFISKAFRIPIEDLFLFKLYEKHGASNLLIPSNKLTKQDNNDLLKQSDKIVAMVDNEAFKPDRSKGTKMEISEHRDDLIGVYNYSSNEWLKDDEIDKLITDAVSEEEYLEGDING